MAKSRSDKQPVGMYLLALTEMSQRFAFWGIGNLLVLFLVQRNHFTDVRADNLFGIFTGIAFVLPVLGGYLGDKLNYRLPVICGMLCTAIGCFLISSGLTPLIYLGLLIVAIGGAVFTPSIYALLGSLYHGKHHLRDSGFSIYYSAVNIGVFLAMFFLGWLGNNGYWSGAFIIAGCVQLLGFLPFRLAQRHFDYQRVKPVHALKIEKCPPLAQHEKNRVWFIVILCFFSVLFWLAYNQGASSMSLFALRFTDRYFGNFEVPPSWLFSSESLYLVLFAMPLAKLYISLASRRLDPPPQLKTALSLFSIAICFLIMAFASAHIPSGAKSASVSIGFPLVAFAFMALGEMLIAPIGLSLITHLSPHRLTAMLVGVWYLCIGVAFYLGGALAPLMSLMSNMSSFFSIFVVLTAIFGLALLLISKRLNGLRHLDKL